MSDGLLSSSIGNAYTGIHPAVQFQGDVGGANKFETAFQETNLGNGSRKMCQVIKGK